MRHSSSIGSLTEERKSVPSRSRLTPVVRQRVSSSCLPTEGGGADGNKARHVDYICCSQKFTLASTPVTTLHLQSEEKLWARWIFYSFALLGLGECPRKEKRAESTSIRAAKPCGPHVAVMCESSNSVQSTNFSAVLSSQSKMTCMKISAQSSG